VDLTIAAPLNWVESVGKLHFPSKADRRLQELMDRNNEGRLDQSEREALEALAELSEQLSLVRAEALQILGKRTRLCQNTSL
jgi:hypothetical protein